MTILTALKDGKLTAEELWRVAQDMAAEIERHGGADILNRYPLQNVGEKIKLYHQLVGLALLGDIRRLLETVDHKLTLGLVAANLIHQVDSADTEEGEDDAGQDV
jgi:hypothetical protein